MNPRKLIATAAGVALLAGGLLAPAASAAETGGTVTTFTLTNGFLSISVPTGDNTTPVSLGAADATLLSGVQASGSLGDTTVTDERNSTTGWTVTASSTDFTQILDGSGLAPVTADTVAASNVGIVIPTASIVVNGGEVLGGTLFTPTAGTTGAAGGAIGNTVADLSTILTALDTTNSVKYNPTITVTVPADTANGTYRATVTQTASAQS